jgi:hypothetical protein
MVAPAAPIAVNQSQRALNCQRRPRAAPRVPDRKNDDGLLAGDVIDVIVSGAKQEPADTGDARRSIRPPDVRCVGHQLETGGQFLGEERWRGEPVLTLPGVDRADVRFGLRCGEDWKAHR